MQRPARSAGDRPAWCHATPRIGCTAKDSALLGRALLFHQGSAQAAEATGEGASAAASTVDGEAVAEGAEQSAEEEALAAEQLQEGQG